MRSSRFAPHKADPDPRFAWLTEQAFAHRGLHGGDVAENSRSAFAAALAAGHGIELDVRLSRDGFAVVFHDADLARMTGTPGPLSARTAAMLGEFALASTADRIEPLSAILRFAGRRSRILVELKTDDDPHVAARLSLSVRHAIEGHGGRVAVMSFDPAVCRWFADHAPHVARGLVVSERALSMRETLRRHLSYRRARPHFLAYDVRAFPSRIAARARGRGVPVLAWTVRTPADRAAAAAHADQIIFERP